MPSVCHSYILLYHPYVTCIYSHVTRMSLICDIPMNRFNDINVFKEGKLYEIIFNLEVNIKSILSRSNLEKTLKRM